MDGVSLSLVAITQCERLTVKPVRRNKMWTPACGHKTSGHSMTVTSNGSTTSSKQIKERRKKKTASPTVKTVFKADSAEYTLYQKGVLLTDHLVSVE